MTSTAKIRVICTLGPASLNASVLSGLDARGVDLFRINLSHTPVEALEETIDFVRGLSNVPISLDTEGAQVRCGAVGADRVLEAGCVVTLDSEDVEGVGERLSLRPVEVFECLRPGSLVSVDFHGAVLRVTDVVAGAFRAVVVRGGRIGSNKAVTVSPAPQLPDLTGKDVAAIAIGRGMGVEDYALSFAASQEGVRQIRGLIPAAARLICKIESRAGVRNLDGIIAGSDVVLIDRGDLSREVPIEEVPYFQKAIVRRANRLHKPLYVATNLLESMVVNSGPTVAEVNDIANTLLDGAHGLVLAAETAIGVDPLGAVDLVMRAIEAFEREHANRFDGSAEDPVDTQPGLRHPVNTRA